MRESSLPFSLMHGRIRMDGFKLLINELKLERLWTEAKQGKVLIRTTMKARQENSTEQTSHECLNVNQLRYEGQKPRVMRNAFMGICEVYIKRKLDKDHSRWIGILG